LTIDGKIEAQVTKQVGMWAKPAWGGPGIAFGEAIHPLQSVNSRYTIQLIDRDGSNKRQLFPFGDEIGVQFPELVWSPTGEKLLFIHNGSLTYISSPGSPPRQLTVNSQASQPQWVVRSVALSMTVPLTLSSPITANGVLSPTTATTSTPRPRSTPTPDARLPLDDSPLQPTAVITPTLDLEELQKDQ